MRLQTCIRCHRQTFDPHTRSVTDWPMIDDANASEHCQVCWMEMGRVRGRMMGGATVKMPPPPHRKPASKTQQLFK